LRNLGSWTSSGVTWNNKPSTSTGSSSVDRVSLSQSSSSTQDYEVDIKEMLKYWLKYGSNSQYGLTLKIQTESPTTRMVFASSDNSTSSKHPKLIIRYIMPIQIDLVDIVHLDYFNRENGTAEVFASGGAGPISYLWSNAKTTAFVDSLTSGLYWVKATDSLGNIAGKYVIIGDEIDTVTISSQPDSILGFDALLSSDYSKLIYEFTTSNIEINAGQFGGAAGGGWEQQTLLGFNFEGLPQNAEITEAKLTLYGKNHSYSSPYSNESYLALVTSGWQEDSVWWDNKPSFITTDSIYLAGSSSSTQNYELDIRNYLQFWTENPNDNFGCLLKIITPNATNKLVFHSSNSATSSKWPKLEFKIKLMQTVIWTNIVNCELIDNKTIQKSISSSDYDAGATSTHLLPEGDDGWFEYTVSQLSDKKMIGFSVFPNLDESDTTINYAFELLANDTILISEMGARNATGRKVLLDDKLKIERIADSLYYKINDVIVARRSINPQEILILDVSLYSSAAKFGKVKISEKFKNILLIFPNLAYAIPKKELNAGIRYCGIITQYELKFKFINKYDNVGENLQYKIYNHLGNITNLPTLQLEEGINLYSINLQSLSLTNGAYYILEITDSKSEKSYLKFKYN
jgi:hypothetical protein